MVACWLGLTDDFANGIIAKRLIELARAGERNPDLLRERATEQLRRHLYGDNKEWPSARPAPLEITASRVRRRQQRLL
jgi:hypothetical protein